MYRGRLKRDFDLWVEKGLLARPAADAMLADYDQRRSAFSVGGVLTMLAALLISASILLLIAANWEEIPRGVKVISVVVLVWVFHLSAGLAFGRGADRLGGAALVLGTMSFGGAIALIGQLYHLSGDTADAMLLWFSGAVVSAFLFRSAAVTVAAGFLAFAVSFAMVDQFDWQWDWLYGWSPIACAIIALALVYRTGADRARHLAYLVGLSWLGWLYGLSDEVWPAVAYALLGTLAFVALTVKGSPLEAIARRAGAAPAFYACALAVLGLLALHFKYDAGGRLAVLAAVTIAFVLLTLALAGRDNGAVRYLAYTVFAGEVLYLSFVTIDSMLGTSSFFLLSGLVVAALAFVVVRMEKLFARRAEEAGR